MSDTQKRSRNELSSSACYHCHTSKVKCDRERPCKRCLRTGKHCVPYIPRKRGRRRVTAPRTTEEIGPRFNELMTQLNEAASRPARGYNYVAEPGFEEATTNGQGITNGEYADAMSLAVTPLVMPPRTSSSASPQDQFDLTKRFLRVFGPIVRKVASDYSKPEDKQFAKYMLRAHLRYLHSVAKHDAFELMWRWGAENGLDVPYSEIAENPTFNVVEGVPGIPKYGFASLPQRTRKPSSDDPEYLEFMQTEPAIASLYMVYTHEKIEVTANPEFVRLFGYSRRDVAEMIKAGNDPMALFFHPDDLDEFIECKASILSPTCPLRVVQCEHVMRCVHKNGSSFVALYKGRWRCNKASFVRCTAWTFQPLPASPYINPSRHAARVAATSTRAAAAASARRKMAAQGSAAQRAGAAHATAAAAPAARGRPPVPPGYRGAPAHATTTSVPMKQQPAVVPNVVDSVPTTSAGGGMPVWSTISSDSPFVVPEISKPADTGFPTCNSTVVSDTDRSATSAGDTSVPGSVGPVPVSNDMAWLDMDVMATLMESVDAPAMGPDTAMPTMAPQWGTAS